MVRTLFPALLSVAFAAQAQSANSPAQFLITQNGKQVGQAQFTVAQAGGAQTWTSSGSVEVQAFSYTFSNTATVDGQGNLARDELSGARGQNLSGQSPF